MTVPPEIVNATVPSLLCVTTCAGLVMSRSTALQGGNTAVDMLASTGVPSWVKLTVMLPPCPLFGATITPPAPLLTRICTSWMDMVPLNVAGGGASGVAGRASAGGGGESGNMTTMRASGWSSDLHAPRRTTASAVPMSPTFMKADERKRMAVSPPMSSRNRAALVCVGCRTRVGRRRRRVREHHGDASVRLVLRLAPTLHRADQDPNGPERDDCVHGSKKGTHDEK